MAIDNNRPYSRSYIKALIEQYIEYRYSYSNTNKESRVWHRKQYASTPKLHTSIIVHKDGTTDINIIIEI